MVNYELFDFFIESIPVIIIVNMINNLTIDNTLCFSETRASKDL